MAKNKGGRPVIKFGDAEKELIIEHCATLNLRQTSDLLGVDVQTLTAVFLRQPTFAQLYQAVKLKANLEVVAVLKSICLEDRNVAAIKLYLQACHPAFKEAAEAEAEADEKIIQKRFDGSLDGDNSHLDKIDKWQEENLNGNEEKEDTKH